MSALVIDLFAGARGWTEGLRRAGFRGRDVGFELADWPSRTAVAAGHTQVRADVAAYPVETIKRKVTGLTGSAPCPPFSRSGKHLGFDDPRANLTLEPIRWVRALRPEWVALEQVAGVLPYWEHVAGELDELGYSTWTGVVSTEEFGVPQVRSRAVLIASRVQQVSAPRATHARWARTERPSDVDPSLGNMLALPRWLSMRDALGWGLDDRPSWTVSAGGADTGGAEVFANAKNRGILRALAAKAGRPHIPTIVSPAEAGVLQGFRADYPWQGPKGRQLQQIGNAVPPPMAAAVVAPLLAAEREVAPVVAKYTDASAVDDANAVLRAIEAGQLDPEDEAAERLACWALNLLAADRQAVAA